MIRAVRYLWVLPILGAMLVPASAANPRIVIVLSDANKIYSLIDQGVKDNIQSEFTEVTLQKGEERVLAANIRQISPSLIIAKGNAAALWVSKTFPEIPLVASGVIYQSNPEIFAKMAGVSLDCSPESYFNLIKEFSPLKGKVGIVMDATHPAGYRNRLESLAHKSDVQVVIKEVSKVNEVSRAIGEIYSEGANVLLLTYDPIIMNPETFKYIIEFSISKNMLVVAPSKALLKGGAMASLEANYIDIGRRTAEIANNLLKDPSLSVTLNLEFPYKEEVSVNRKIAKSIDMNIPSAILKRAVYIHD